MRTLVDTSSLVSLARYYYPFDSTDILNEYLNSEIASGNIIVLDKIAEEVQYVSRGMAVEAFSCLKDKNRVVSTKDLIPKPQFFNMLDNSFVDNATKRLKFNDDEAGYNNERDVFLKGADCALVVYAMNNTSKMDPIQILTEESANQNDGKLFKKIPLICKVIGIRTLTSVEFLKELQSIKVNIERLT